MHFSKAAVSPHGPWNGSGLILLFACLLAIAFPCQSLLCATLLARLQMEGVPLSFLDDILMLDLPVEVAQNIFKGSLS
jgi:hypothetical protein